jgi:hypothetical protein
MSASAASDSGFRVPAGNLFRTASSGVYFKSNMLKMPKNVNTLRFHTRN